MSWSQADNVNTVSVQCLVIDNHRRYTYDQAKRIVDNTPAAVHSQYFYFALPRIEADIVLKFVYFK